jgi:hypothetical protein
MLTTYIYTEDNSYINTVEGTVPNLSIGMKLSLKHEDGEYVVGTIYEIVAELEDSDVDYIVSIKDVVVDTDREEEAV